jgi:hypothetical protein
MAGAQLGDLGILFRAVLAGHSEHLLASSHAASFAVADLWLSAAVLIAGEESSEGFPVGKMFLIYFDARVTSGVSERKT